MDFKQIQELVKMINKSNIGEVTIEQKDFKVTIKQKEEHVTQVMQAQPCKLCASATRPSCTPDPPAASPSTAGASDKIKAGEAAPSNLITIKSPMIGTFYRKAIS